MIPKIIHYVWLGGAAIPEDIQACIDSWKRHLPDYEIRCWEDSCVDEVDSIFVREAIAEKKWAFASDVIRLYAITKYGGIYLDTDVMLYQSLDPLLSEHAFIGRENSIHMQGKKTINYLTTCCFGAEVGNPFMQLCYNYYKDRHFITSLDRSLPVELRLDIRLNSEIFCILAQQIGYNANVLANKKQTCKDFVLTIFPSWCFDATQRKVDTYAKHLALGTWREGPKRYYTYTWQYKLQWRVRACVEWVLRRFDYAMIKLS